jgi:hypothetical protein
MSNARASFCNVERLGLVSPDSTDDTVRTDKPDAWATASCVSNRRMRAWRIVFPIVLFVCLMGYTVGYWQATGKKKTGKVLAAA